MADSHREGVKNPSHKKMHKLVSPQHSIQSLGSLGHHDTWEQAELKEALVKKNNIFRPKKCSTDFFLTGRAVLFLPSPIEFVHNRGFRRLRLFVSGKACVQFEIC